MTREGTNWNTTTEVVDGNYNLDKMYVTAKVTKIRRVPYYSQDEITIVTSLYTFRKKKLGSRDYAWIFENKKMLSNLTIPKII